MKTYRIYYTSLGGKNLGREIVNAESFEQALTAARKALGNMVSIVSVFKG